MTATRGALAIAAIALAASTAAADLRVAAVFDDHMVLQQQMPVPVWGWADPGQSVTVSFARSEVQAVADEAGRWRVNLSAMPASAEPQDLTVVSGGRKLVCRDVLVGEVWLAAGQSNMDWPVSECLNAEAEIASADHPRIRYLKIPHRIAGVPLDDLDFSSASAETTTAPAAPKWRVCSPATVGSFDGVGYFFARFLHRELDVPVGVINVAWGGTHINGFIPLAGYEAEPGLSNELNWFRETKAEYGRARDQYIAAMDRWLTEAKSNRAAGRPVPDPLPLAWPADPIAANRHMPTALYNAMIHPLVPAARRGAIWYQGEMNLIDGLFYFVRMKGLIAGLRAVWNQPDMPFYYVQLAPGADSTPWRLPLIWEAQARVMTEVPHTGMAATMDIGDLDSVHPRNKQDVGRRLGLWALARTYGRENLVCCGPIYDSMTIEGDRIRLRFRHTGSGLASRDGQPLSWFTIAGPDNSFVSAQAEIDGHTVIVRHKDIANPTAVRFAWHTQAQPNLINKEGLPAIPFRTDSPPLESFYHWRGPASPCTPED